MGLELSLGVGVRVRARGRAHLGPLHLEGTVERRLCS